MAVVTAEQRQQLATSTLLCRTPSALCAMRRAAFSGCVRAPIFLLSSLRGAATWQGVAGLWQTTAAAMGTVERSARGLVATISRVYSVVHHWSGAVLHHICTFEAMCSRFTVVTITLVVIYEPLLATCGGFCVLVYRTVFQPQPRSSKGHDFGVRV